MVLNKDAIVQCRDISGCMRYLDCRTSSREDLYHKPAIPQALWTRLTNGGCCHKERRPGHQGKSCFDNFEHLELIPSPLKKSRYSRVLVHSRAAIGSRKFHVKFECLRTHLP